MTNLIKTEESVNTHKELIKGAVLSAIGFALVFFDPTMVLNLLLAAGAIPFLAIAPTHVSSALRYKTSQSQYKTLGNLMLVASVLFFPLYFLIGLKFLAVSFFVMVFGIYTRMNVNKKIEPTTIRKKYVSSDADSSNKTNSNNNRSDKSAKSQSATHSPQVELPLTIHRQAFHLAKLLPEEDFQLLEQLIKSLNEAHANLEYLKEHHEYLAGSVNELINDVAVNSISRLNEMAQTFVKYGRVDDNAKALFAEKHQQQVHTLLQSHLEELTALNASIVEKQMAGFSTVGSEGERKFRDSVMELRILLKWFVAQTPENSVCSYEVISRKLEENTLKQMHDVFYQHDTTEEQRDELQCQIEELITHFQAQSPKEEHRSQDNLLQLTEDTDLLHQSETQQFIDFNKQYVKQLKEHW